MRECLLFKWTLSLLLFIFLLEMFVYPGPVACATEPRGGSESTLGIEPRHSAAPKDERRGGVVLVLSGGGTKGFAHVGVLKMLEEMDIPIAGIVGTSIGALIGGLYATGIHADDLHEIIMDTNIMGLLADSGTRIKPGAGDHRPVGENVKIFQTLRDKDFRPAGPLGLLPAMSLLSFLNKYAGGVHTTDFMKLPIPFACVAADIGTGDTVVLSDGNLTSAIRASVAIPGLLEPWPLNGRLLVDGGLVANLPVEIARELFPGYPVLAVNLSGQSIAKRSDQFSSLIDVLVQTIDVMTIDRIKRNEALADLVLYPDVSGFSMLDSTGYETIFQRGLQVAKDNRDKIAALSASAPPPVQLASDPHAPTPTVLGIRVEGLHETAAAEIERYYQRWVGKPYDAEKVNEATELLMKREEIATVDIDIVDIDPVSAGEETAAADIGINPVSADDPKNVVVIFSVERRVPYEITLDGYSSNIHPHRWLGATFTGRGLAAPGDSGSVEGRWANDEWGARVRYFTPLVDQKQWGFAFNTVRERFDPEGADNYTLDRHSGRIMYYKEGVDQRIGFGIAGEHTNAADKGSFVWGPYLYFNRDTLDNVLVPTRGHSVSSRVWWNSDEILVSHTNLTAYIPLKSDLHFVLNFGLRTGDRNHQAYRALLGSNEELFSLSRHPYAGDQAAWGHLGVGYNFYNSWWGAIRGEAFAAYGMVMDNWSRAKDAWEAGLAFSVPGQFFNGRLILVYDEDDEFTVGFTIGSPRWWSSPLP